MPKQICSDDTNLHCYYDPVQISGSRDPKNSKFSVKQFSDPRMFARRSLDIEKTLRDSFLSTIITAVRVIYISLLILRFFAALAEAQRTSTKLHNDGTVCLRNTSTAFN